MLLNFIRKAVCSDPERLVSDGIECVRKSIFIVLSKFFWSTGRTSSIEYLYCLNNFTYL